MGNRDQAGIENLPNVFVDRALESITLLHSLTFVGAKIHRSLQVSSTMTMFRVEHRVEI